MLKKVPKPEAELKVGHTIYCEQCSWSSCTRLQSLSAAYRMMQVFTYIILCHGYVLLQMFILLEFIMSGILWWSVCIKWIQWLRRINKQIYDPDTANPPRQYPHMVLVLPLYWSGKSLYSQQCCNIWWLHCIPWLHWMMLLCSIFFTTVWSSPVLNVYTVVRWTLSAWGDIYTTAYVSCPTLFG